MAAALGVGSVISFSTEVCELVGALGCEVVSLGSATGPAAVTLANGIHPLNADDVTTWPPALAEIAQSMTITQVAHGRANGVAATLLGSVYTWGSNDSGQLGTGQVSLLSADVARVEGLRDKRIIAVAAGDAHCLALSGMFG